ncbi:pyridoxal phosphate-dependent aminotransferase [uncultured Cetobacterium sp.]|uniref:pyridoxal phosphate-dependent aminotransferase n=1 Tax=uncultured Cetobacterium sp. TaxID=527638 RepID=UPI002602E950|nr:pyridoxal phosphate-dependent aminotransferase [uncultured Cetobacterium sp.]
MINKNVLNLKSSLIREISNESKKYEDVLNLTIGEPDLPTPIGITNACIEYMKNNNIKYSMTGGIVELKNEVAKYYNNKYKSNYLTENVLICAGSTEALSSTLKTLICPGDEILIAVPAYPGYAPLIEMAMGKCVFFDTEKDSFKITINNLKKNISEKTKALILNYPNNPTGVCLNSEELQEILNFCIEKNIVVISDEIYEGLAFKKSVSVAMFAENHKNIILIGGFSKSHSMTGYRVGYVIGDLSIIENIKKVSQYTVTSPNTISQIGAIEALKQYSDTRVFAEEYKKRFDYLEKKLKKINIFTIKSQGGIYLFFKNPLENKTSLEFVMEFLKKEKVALVPGEAFGKQGYVRVSLVKSIEKLREFSKKMESFLKK